MEDKSVPAKAHTIRVPKNVIPKNIAHYELWMIGLSLSSTGKTSILLPQIKHFNKQHLIEFSFQEKGDLSTSFQLWNIQEKPPALLWKYGQFKSIELPKYLAENPIQRINFWRKNFCVPPLRTHPALTRAAEKYAKKICIQSPLKHIISIENKPDKNNPNENTLPRGNTPELRAEEFGYQGWVSENLARGENLEAALLEIEASPAHFINQLHPDITYVGLGLHLSKEFTCLVELFGSTEAIVPRKLPTQLTSRLTSLDIASIDTTEKLQNSSDCTMHGP